MSESANSSALQAIGETAGTVWRTLEANGPMSVAKLLKAVGGNKDLVQQAIGWLAREDKITITEVKRTKTVALR
jgi:hypothetical protein